jgi:hypothetical protein
MRNYLWFIVMCSLWVTACHPASQATTGSEAVSAVPIFMAAEHLNNSRISEFSTILRARHVSVDFTVLTVTATTLTLNLFEDVTFTAVRDRLEMNASGSFSWVGHLNGIAYSEVILTVKDGILIGNVALPQALYQIRYVRDGVHEIAHINQAAFPPD